MAGTLEVVTGSMFSGKTSELIRRLRLCMLAKKKVQIFKSYRDNRYKDEALVSHDGFELPGFAVRNSADILRSLDAGTKVVGIDEAQFFDLSLVSVCESLANRGLRVIVAGLDLDYRGEPFEIMTHLLARAEKVTKNLAICSVCGEDAHYSQLLKADSAERIIVAAADRYEARCRECFKSPDSAASPAREAILGN
ncbi:MAG: thymidine kinase [Elusimicrobiota bacterium]